MADESTERDDGAADGDPSGGTGLGTKIVLVLVVLVGLSGGFYLGGAKLSEPVGSMLAARAQRADDGGGHGGGGHGADEAGPSPIHMVDNLVVNPARSGGSRFLLTTIAVEVVDPGLTEMVAEHDVQIRASLILVLGSKTTEELTDIEGREAIVAQVKEHIERILGRDVVKHVFIPQFVIQ